MQLMEVKIRVLKRITWKKKSFKNHFLNTESIFEKFSLRSFQKLPTVSAEFGRCKPFRLSKSEPTDRHVN